jgi:hypothetical protein
MEPDESLDGGRFTYMGGLLPFERHVVPQLASSKVKIQTKLRQHFKLPRSFTAIIRSRVGHVQA